MSHTSNRDHRKASLPAVLVAALALLLVTANPALAANEGAGPVEITGGAVAQSCAEITEFGADIYHPSATFGSYTGALRITVDTTEAKWWAGPAGTYGNNTCTTTVGYEVEAEFEVASVGNSNVDCGPDQGTMKRDAGGTTFVWTSASANCTINGVATAVGPVTHNGILVGCPAIILQATYTCGYEGSYSY